MMWVMHYLYASGRAPVGSRDGSGRAMVGLPLFCLFVWLLHPRLRAQDAATRGTVIMSRI